MSEALQEHLRIEKEINHIIKAHCKGKFKGEERTCTPEGCWMLRIEKDPLTINFFKAHNLNLDRLKPGKCGHSTDPNDRDGCLRFCSKGGDPVYIADFKLIDGKKIWIRGSST